eukprot:scaffold208251_cov30-Tisochrysis_lutea.AAC.3
MQRRLATSLGGSGWRGKRWAKHSKPTNGAGCGLNGDIARDLGYLNLNEGAPVESFIDTDVEVVEPELKKWARISGVVQPERGLRKSDHYLEMGRPSLCQTCTRRVLG